MAKEKEENQRMVAQNEGKESNCTDKCVAKIDDTCFGFSTKELIGTNCFGIVLGEWWV